MLHSGLWKRIFWLVKTIFYIFFRDSCQWNFFFRLAETYFWTNALFRLLEKDFFSQVETVYFIWDFISNTGNRHWYERKTSFKDRTTSYEWKLIFWLVETIFFHCHKMFSKEFFIADSGNPFVSVKVKVLLFIQSFLSC